jgi:hypothetical protein
MGLVMAAVVALAPVAMLVVASIIFTPHLQI